MNTNEVKRGLKKQMAHFSARVLVGAAIVPLLLFGCSGSDFPDVSFDDVSKDIVRVASNLPDEYFAQSCDPSSKVLDPEQAKSYSQSATDISSKLGGLADDLESALEKGTVQYRGASLREYQGVINEIRKVKIGIEKLGVFHGFSELRSALRKASAYLTQV